MALPPEQINIKRRREEEPVETLYIQSELPQTKRRFTDFLFQRVRIGGTPPGGVGGGDSKSGPPTAASTPGGGLLAAHRSLRSPRSASSLTFPSTGTGAGRSDGVPIVRATSPGAEFRDAKRLVAARKEAEEKIQRALRSSAATDPTQVDSATTTTPANAASGGVSTPLPKSLEESPAASPSPGKLSPASSSSVRRFQISRSSTPGGFKTPLGGAGVQKKRPGEVGGGVGGSAPAVAILVERLRRRKQPSKKASMVELALKPENVALNVATVPSDSGVGGAEEVGVRSRKRPVVNQAEKRWREEQQVAISAAKEHLSQVLEKEAHQTRRQSNWEEEEERLAREFEQIALEMEGQGGQVVQTLPEEQPAITSARAGLPKPALKYQPRSPNVKTRDASSAAGVPQTLEAAPQAFDAQGHLHVGSAAASLATSNQPDLDNEEDDDTDGEYVYDTYIRRPLPDGVFLNRSSVDKETSHETWLQMYGIDTTRPDVGVIVIPQEDEEYWEHFAEDDEDEDQWDSEDADSNAENNPANDYPEEELSAGDEGDDSTAIYSRYRHRAASDEEEFDVDEYDSEGEFLGRSGYSMRHRVGQSDEDGDLSDS